MFTVWYCYFCWSKNIKKSFCLTVKSPPALRHTVCNMLTAVFIMTGCNIWAAARYTQIILFKILNDRSSVSSLGAVASALSRLNHIKHSSSPRSFHLSLSRVFLLSPFFFSFFFFFSQPSGMYLYRVSLLFIPFFNSAAFTVFLPCASHMPPSCSLGVWSCVHSKRKVGRKERKERKKKKRESG